MKLILLVGIPASGKTTLANQLVTEKGFERLCADDIRLELYGDEAEQGNPKDVFAIFFERLEALFIAKKNIVIDNTNVRREHRRQILDRAKQFNYNDIELHVFDVPLPLCLHRNKERTRQVKEEIIINLHKELNTASKPTTKEGKIIMVKPDDTLTNSSVSTSTHVLPIRNKEIIFGKRTYIMGIVNVTPDSFSKDGLLDAKEAVNQALNKIKSGADIIDIGGQSTRPGHTPIDEETEAKRIIPVIRELRKNSDTIISVDTFSANVFEKALEAGADMLNSIWGLNIDLAKSIKKRPVPTVIMHNKAQANYPNKGGVVKEVVDYLAQQAEKAINLGLTPAQIILDPGIGFGKTAEHNLEILTAFKQITALGFPTLIGTSRKSTIGKLLDRPVDQRVLGTAATVAYAIAQGVDIVRVHDVPEILDVIKVSDALVRRWRPENWTTNE